MLKRGASSQDRARGGGSTDQMSLLATYGSRRASIAGAGLKIEPASQLR